MESYGDNPDRLGIWDSKPSNEPFKWQEDDADDFEVYEDVRPASPWWRVSILTVATSLIAFTLGAGAAQFVRPAPVYVSPQLEIGIASAPSHNVRERVKGTVIHKNVNRRHSRSAWVNRRLAAARQKNASGQTRQPGTVIVAAVPTSVPAAPTTSSQGSVRLIKNSSGPNLITKQSKPAGTTQTQSHAVPPQEESSGELGSEEDATNEDASTARNPDSDSNSSDDEVESTEPDSPGHSNSSPNGTANGHNKPPKD